MNNWDHRFLCMARLVASWSKDPSTKVGCVIADDQHRILSTGFNGLPRGIDDDAGLLTNRDAKLSTIIHAETNALLLATRSVAGATCYVWPVPPCAHCSCLLIQSGIVKVVAPVPPEEFISRWGISLISAADLLIEAGVELTLVQGEL
jgi:dCMP deaminase